MTGTKPEIVFIKPKHGRKVPIPQYMHDTKEYFGKYLPEEGLQVQKTHFWIKRQQDDDIEEVRGPNHSSLEQETAYNATTRPQKAKEEAQE